MGIRSELPGMKRLFWKIRGHGTKRPEGLGSSKTVRRELLSAALPEEGICSTLNAGFLPSAIILNRNMVAAQQALQGLTLHAAIFSGQ